MNQVTRDNPLGLPTVGHEVKKDRACSKCGYNLKGLKTGDRCPECGTVIGLSKITPGSGGQFSEAPTEFIKLLRLGAVLVAACGPIAVIGFFLGTMVFKGTTSSPSPPGPLCIAAGALATAGWAGGVHLLHLAIPGDVGPTSVGKEPVSSRRVWRLANIISQWCFVAWALIALLMWVGGTAAGVSLTNNFSVRAIAGCLFFVGLVGSVPTFFYFAWLCLWAGDEETATRLRVGPFMALGGAFLLGVPILFIVGAVFAWGKFGMITAITTVLLTLGLFYTFSPLLRGLLGLATLFSWAVTNRDTEAAVNARAAKRIAKRVQDNTFHD